MKKRRVVCILLAIAMLSALLTGCSSKSTQTASTQSTSTQTASAQSSGTQSASSQAASSQSSSEPVEIYMFLGSPEFKEPTQALCDEYMKENPNVKITYEATEDITTDLAAKINTGTLPDIFMRCGWRSRCSELAPATK